MLLKFPLTPRTPNFRDGHITHLHFNPGCSRWSVQAFTPFLLKVSRTQKNWGMCDVGVVFFFDLTKLLLYLHDNLNDIRWGKTHTRMGGSTTKIQLVFFWFYFTFQDLDHHPFFHHLAKKGSWAPTTKISFAMNTNKKQRGALHQENMAHTGQDKLLSSIQDPSYEFQSGGKSATRVVSRGNWIRN